MEIVTLQAAVDGVESLKNNKLEGEIANWKARSLDDNDFCYKLLLLLYIFLLNDFYD